jgi:hypothetical protein
MPPGHDRKMTKKWDFRTAELKSLARDEGVQRGEKSSGDVLGVSDSRIDLKMLGDRHQGGKQRRASPHSCKFSFPPQRPKRTPRSPPFIPALSFQFQRWRSQILGDSNQH